MTRNDIAKTIVALETGSKITVSSSVSASTIEEAIRKLGGDAKVLDQMAYDRLLSITGEAVAFRNGLKD